MSSSTWQGVRAPLIRIEVKELFTAFFFAKSFLVLNYIACKLLTDKIIKTINKKYLCQVPLDKITFSYKIP